MQRPRINNITMILVHTSCFGKTAKPSLVKESGEMFDLHLEEGAQANQKDKEKMGGREVQGRKSGIE